MIGSIEKSYDCWSLAARPGYLLPTSDTSCWKKDHLSVHAHYLQWLPSLPYTTSCKCNETPMMRKRTEPDTAQLPLTNQSCGTEFPLVDGACNCCAKAMRKRMHFFFGSPAFPSNPLFLVPHSRALLQPVVCWMLHLCKLGALLRTRS
jgi:hypothetical protein